MDDAKRPARRRSARAVLGTLALMASLLGPVGLAAEPDRPSGTAPERPISLRARPGGGPLTHVLEAVRRLLPPWPGSSLLGWTKSGFEPPEDDRPNDERRLQAIVDGPDPTAQDGGGTF